MDDSVCFLIAEALVAVSRGDFTAPTPPPWELQPGPAEPSPSSSSAEPPRPPFPPKSIPKRKRSRQITLQGIHDAMKEEEEEKLKNENNAALASPTTPLRFAAGSTSTGSGRPVADGQPRAKRVKLDDARSPPPAAAAPSSSSSVPNYTVSSSGPLKFKLHRCS